MPTTVTDEVGSVAETTVLYEPGHLVDAQKVLSSLSGMAVLGEGVPPGGADVAVIAGTDLAVQAPSTPRAPSSTGTSFADHLNDLAATNIARRESELQLQPAVRPDPVLRSAFVLVAPTHEPDRAPHPVRPRPVMRLGQSKKYKLPLYAPPEE